MKITNRKTPYVNGKPRYKVRQRPGVYLIFKNNELRYIGYSSSDIYKTLYRHFQTWNDNKQVRIIYKSTDEKISVRVIYTNTAAQAAKLERALIIQYAPPDNPQQYIEFENTNSDIQIIEEANTIVNYDKEVPF